VAPEALAWAQRPAVRLASPDAQPAEVSRAWWHFFGFLRGQDALEQDQQAAMRELSESGSTAAQLRLVRLTEALLAQRRGEMEDDEDEAGAAL
jgi:hypothetical protein